LQPLLPYQVQIIHHHLHRLPHRRLRLHQLLRLDQRSERQHLAVLTVEHMDGRRIDRVSLRLLDSPEPAEGVGT